MHLKRRTSHLGVVHWLALMLVLAVGVILVLVATTASGTMRDVLREAGIVTIGTVGVTLLYDIVLRPSHDRHVLNLVRDSLIGRAREYGLSGIERVDFCGLFRGLDRGSELCWLDTYCPDLDSPDVQDALREAIERGATIRMLVIDPECDTAEARAHEIVARGYQPEEFQKDARHNLAIVEEIKSALSEKEKARLDIRRYSGLPCAPMYLRRRDGKCIEGWTSYFLTLPTYEAAHFYWGQPGAAAPRLSAGRGIGLEAFQTYFENKWDAADSGHQPAPEAEAARLLTDAKATLEQLRKRQSTFALSLFAADLERTIVEPGNKVLADGKLRREQTAASRELLLDLARGQDVLLVHSTSENEIFKDVAFWHPFHEQLLTRVEAGQITGVRRLFVLPTGDETETDAVLLRQIEFHTRTDKFDYRLLLQRTYREIQEDVRVTAFPVHDFGIYGSVAYVWPRQGYAARDESARGYFQVDPKTVARYRDLHVRCWEQGRRLETWAGALTANV